MLAEANPFRYPPLHLPLLHLLPHPVDRHFCFRHCLSVQPSRFLPCSLRRTLVAILLLISLFYIFFPIHAILHIAFFFIPVTVISMSSSSIASVFHLVFLLILYLVGCFFFTLYSCQGFVLLSLPVGFFVALSTTTSYQSYIRSIGFLFLLKVVARDTAHTH